MVTSPWMQESGVHRREENNMRKAYNVTLNKHDAKILKKYLYACKIVFETSAYFDSIYFTMYLDKSELDKVNEFLEIL